MFGMGRLAIGLQATFHSVGSGLVAASNLLLTGETGTFLLITGDALGLVGGD